MAEFTKEQLIEHAQAESAALKAMIEHGGYSDDVVDFLKRKMQLDEIALAVLTAEAEVWEIENPGEGTFYSAHPPRDFEKASCVYYRLPLLEGLK